jgi:hypothetical protein
MSRHRGGSRAGSKYEAQTLGFDGLGHMGQPMSAQLVKIQTSLSSARTT